MGKTMDKKNTVRKKGQGDSFPSVKWAGIVGAKGTTNYGGFEFFIDKLTEYHQDNRKIRYCIDWKGRESKEFEYHNAHCFQIKVPNIGLVQAIYYDVVVLSYCIRYIKEHNIQNPAVYVLACRIGSFTPYFQRQIHKLGSKLYVNPGGQYEIIWSTRENLDVTRGYGAWPSNLNSVLRRQMG